MFEYLFSYFSFISGVQIIIKIFKVSQTPVLVTQYNYGATYLKPLSQKKTGYPPAWQH